MEGEELTAQETALYDRQIRVWGASAQRRLSKSNVLVYGLKGTIAEFCKNIVLAGIGSLTLVDDRPITEEASSSNFLIPCEIPDSYIGKTLADICCDSLKDFNPMVHVSVEKGQLESFSVEFFKKFDVVVVSCCSPATKKLTNAKCRMLSKRISFYAVECRDSCGEIFVDLQDYSFLKKQKDDTVECELHYPSFQEVASVPWKALPRRLSKLFYAMRVLERFEEAEGRKPGEIFGDDYAALLRLKKELCESHSVDEAIIPDVLLERLIKGNAEFPPVCAIVGGILGQEVIKAVSGKGVPLKNFFFYDAMDGKGIIEDIVVC